ncbi:hypothetical protein DMB37_15055 [Nocardia sp. CS682]|nr:hypothetical protein DMB37_15055 [Nocardia sp. CS682]
MRARSYTPVFAVENGHYRLDAYSSRRQVALPVELPNPSIRSNRPLSAHRARCELYPVEFDRRILFFGGPAR